MGGDGTTTHHASSCTYVIVLAGEFLQLTSNLRMLVCIHHVVVPPELPAAVVTGTESGDGGWGGCGSGGGGGGGGGGKDVLKYKPRVSATMFLHPCRCKGALLDVGRDLSGGGEQQFVQSAEFLLDDDDNDDGRHVA